MNRAPALIFAILLLPGITGAGEVYQCTSADGSKSFQATPCPTNTSEQVKRMASVATSSSNSTAASNHTADPAASSCRAGVSKEYAVEEKSVEDYYKRGQRICKDNFEEDSFQIKNCRQEQDEVRAQKLRELERGKLRALSYCDN